MAKRPAKKRAKQKIFKSPRAAAKVLKARAAKAAKPAPKLNRDSPSKPDAVAQRVLAPALAIEHPKGLPPRPVNTRWPAEIIVGKRHRRDYGDLKSLAASISERGALLQPVVISPANELIAGDRRLKAWPQTKFKAEPIPVRVVTIDSIVAGEWDENAERKDFTPSEAVAIHAEIKKQLGVLAQERMRAGKKAAPEAKGKSGDHAARVAGRDRRTLDKAAAVVEAAERAPERFGKLARDMDRTGKVNGPFKRLQVIEQTERLRQAPPPLPMRGPYHALVVDYPWPAEKDAEQDDIDARGRAMRGYPEMAIEKGCAFFASQAFQALLAPDCTVYFLTTNHHMDQAFVLLKAMGFPRHSTIGTWGKDKMGRGQVLRGKTEHCIIATRGKPTINLTNQTTLWQGPGWEVREDSRKPDAFFALVEELTPAPRYAEIFSRGGRGEKWDCHGDQVGKFAAPQKGEARLPEKVARAAEAALVAEAKAPKPTGEKKTPRRTLPGRDAELIAFAEKNGHVVSMTLAFEPNSAIRESIGTCACGWSHREPGDDLAPNDPEGVKLRMARAAAMDEAISAHWREERARVQNEAAGAAANVVPSPLGGEGSEAMPQENSGEGAGDSLATEPPHPSSPAESPAQPSPESSRKTGVGALSVGEGAISAAAIADAIVADPLDIPGFLRRGPDNEPPRATTLVNPKLLPQAQEIAAIADRAEAGAK